MKPVLARLTLAALAVLYGLPVFAAEDLTLVSKSTVNGKTSTGTQYVSEKKMRTDDGAGSDMIFDLETGTLTFIEHKKKRYWQATAEQMQAQMQQVASVLEGNPLADRLLGEMTDVKVEEMGEKKEIAGYPCVMMSMTMGEGFTTEMCVAKGVKPPLSYFDARKAMTAMMGPLAARFETMYEEMSKIDGMPLETVTRSKMMGREMVSESVVTEVEFGSLPADAFEIPADYKKKKSPYE